MNPTVYLAGPISGLGYDDATEWRERATYELAQVGIRAFSPMRGKEYLAGVGRKLEHPYPVGTRVKVMKKSGVSIADGTIVGPGPKGVSYYIQHFVDGVLHHGHFHRSVVEPLSADVGFSSTCEEYGHLSPLSGPRGIMTRDRFDATRCDVLLVNLIGASKVSIGTAMEIAWADLKRTPIVVCMEPEGNPHEHCMITEAIGFRCSTLGEGLDVVKAILS